jgi:hypothetical protein
VGLFNRIFGKDKIRVQFIDSLSGESIGISEMNADQLPETFSVPTTMHIHEDEWKVVEAIPENATDFTRTKSLVLKLRKLEKMATNDIWFTTPTISNEFPQTVAITERSGSDIHITEDDYRQKEFLNRNALPLIEEEFTGIGDVRKNHSRQNDGYTLFKNCHVRKVIGLPDLTISFSKLKQLLNCSSAGQVILNEEKLANGFSLKTDNTSFFGKLESDNVTELCIAGWNENSRNEIMEINKSFGLLFVDWCHCDIIK